jgi:hypothetical protein
VEVALALPLPIEEWGPRCRHHQQASAVVWKAQETAAVARQEEQRPQQPRLCCRTQGRHLHRQGQSWRQERVREPAHPLVPGLELELAAAHHLAQQGRPPALEPPVLRPPACCLPLPEHRRPALARLQELQLQLVPELRLELVLEPELEPPPPLALARQLRPALAPARPQLLRKQPERCWAAPL